ncbi:hypothetical protein HPB47_021950 [Ixodes persulcatus]|uniref:Uncharacterized protein n=1 Tax=Ixodes persulcatus TaxID=34615 RepID=A0AC60QEG7_IXOPE|nr:hypothetical protein HPB47_021950 [Ixodes persulcatus]
MTKPAWWSFPNGGSRPRARCLSGLLQCILPNPPPETLASPEARIISMVSLKARLLLLVAYVGSVTVVVTIERYWTSSGEFALTAVRPQ